ncbi:glutamine-rich protein 2 [Erethizon dorsatum]
MPPATPAGRVSLRELADLAIGTPEVGAVNFTALHTLIVAVLKNLNLQEALVDFQSLSPEGGRSVESLHSAEPLGASRGALGASQLQPSKEKRKSGSRTSFHALESKVKDLGSQVQDLTQQLKDVDSQMQVVTHVQQITPKTVELDFEAPVVLEVKEKAMRDTEEAQKRLTKVQKEVKKSLQEVLQRVDELEKLVKERDDFLESIGQKMNFLPYGEEVTMVTWEELEQTISDGWKSSQALGLLYPSTTPPGVVPISASQVELIPPGLIQFSADQQGFMQPSLEGSDFIQPGTEQHDLIQPDRDQSALGQPGTYQPGLAQPVGDQHGLAQPGEDQPGLAQPSAGQPGLAQPGAGQRGLAQPGADQHGLVQPGAVQQGLVQPGADQPGLAQPGAYQHGLAQPGADQPGLAQPGADQPGLAQPSADQPGLVQPGAFQRGLAQPGADQPGLAQPGAAQRGLAQSGAGQPGLAQPGAVQRGVVQPGAVQRGLAQPGADQRGLAQPGADQPGLGQPGADQHGLVQPGEYPPGLPGADSHRLVQPGIGQGGLVQPRAGQHGFVQPGIPQYVQINKVWCNPVQISKVWCNPVQVNKVWCNPVQVNKVWCNPVQISVVWYHLVQSNMVQCNLVLISMIWYHLVKFNQRGLAQPGAGQFGTVQSGKGSRSFRSPHPYQHGVVPPGQEQYGQVSPLLPRQGLSSPRTDTQGLEPPETDQQGLMHPGSAQLDPDQQGQLYPGAVRPGHVYPVGDQQGPAYPGYGGPGYMGADPHRRVALDPNRILAFPAQTDLGQDATSFRSQDSFGFLQVSSEGSEPRSGAGSERRESVEKLLNFPMAVETLRLMGELTSLYVELKGRIKDLDEEKAGQNDLEKIQFLFTLWVKKILPPDLEEQMKILKALTKEVRQEKAKLDKIQRILEGDSEQVTGKELKSGQLGLQLGVLRVTVTDIEKELAELRDSQERGKATMENSVAEASLYLQDQLDKLRTIIENMLASSSTLLSLSMTPRKPLTTLAPGQIDPEATCPACSLDLSHQVSTLVQRYEQLQEMVSNLAASRPSKKAKLQSQDEELLGHVQSAILQVQGDCEKLNITTSNLIEDHRQKQKDIDVLYQGLEKLEKEKANREHLQMEMDVKADKHALASKVSRVQFDATTEQLNHMMQELMAKMSGQEQDWQKLLDKLLAEMDMKLDRLELDPLKQALEDRWKSLREQLKERSPLYQADEAAAMRRQLLAHFHCLSCDRPLETPVTGQIIPVISVGQALPGHRSSRPYTVFELEQVRQQSRNLKLGSTFPRGDQSSMERSVGRLCTMHSKMLLDIEKVQIHFGGSVRASSQMICELLQAHCLSSPCYKRVPDCADYTYSTMSRRCGGSHTLTYPYRRNRQQHLPQGLYAPEEIQIAMKHDEVDILGLDGHIYKGRMDTRLPGILTKDSEYPETTKHKPKQSRPRGHTQQPLSNTSQLPFRPQSAQMLAGNNPVSSGQRKDRPVSSEGRLAQSEMAHPPSPDLQGSSLGLEMNMAMSPEEGLEEPTRGPRSGTAQ